MAADVYGRIHEACMAAAHAMLTLPDGDYQGRIDDIVNDCLADLREELEEDTSSREVLVRVDPGVVTLQIRTADR